MKTWLIVPSLPDASRPCRTSRSERRASAHSRLWRRRARRRARQASRARPLSPGRTGLRVTLADRGARHDCTSSRSSSPSWTPLLAGQRVEDLERRAAALGRAAFHVALEVGRAVLAGEVDRPLRDALVAAEQGVLARRASTSTSRTGSGRETASTTSPCRSSGFVIPGKTISSSFRNAFAYVVTCLFVLAFEYGTDGANAPATLPPL